MRQTLTEIYEARVAEGRLRADPAQHAVLPVLESLRLWLETTPPRKTGLLASYGKAGQSLPAGVGQPTLLVSGITVGGTA